LLLMDDVTDQMRLGRDPAHGAASGPWWRAPAYCDLHRHEGQHPDLEQGGATGNWLSLEELKGRPFFDYCDQTGAANVGSLLTKGHLAEFRGEQSNLKTKDGVPSGGLGLSQMTMTRHARWASWWWAGT